MKDRDTEPSPDHSAGGSTGTRPEATPAVTADTSPEPSAVAIRRATAEDVDAVARIWHAGWVDGHLGNVPDELVEHRLVLAPFITRTRERVPTTWVAESDHTVVGFVVVVDAEVEQVYVAPAARGTGAATRLLQQAEAVIRLAGHHTAWLAVVAGNQRARAFYARQGWRDRGPLQYGAQTATGTVTVATRRYERDLSRLEH